jgi:hypothetical protein
MSLVLMLEWDDIVHHGDCIGADADFHTIALSRGLSIVIHPPENPVKRAYCSPGQVMRPKPYLDRNHDIVDSCTLLIACPSTDEEEVRSGTWATIRYARKVSRTRIIVYPSGRVEVQDVKRTHTGPTS